MSKKWLIWSIEHDAWWAPDCNGYVKDIAEAGRYSFQNALEIVKGANIARGQHEPPNESMVMAPEDQ